MKLHTLKNELGEVQKIYRMPYECQYILREGGSVFKVCNEIVALTHKKNNKMYLIKKYDFTLVWGHKQVLKYFQDYIKKASLSEFDYLCSLNKRQLIDAINNNENIEILKIDG